MTDRTRLEIRRATASDLRAYYGGDPPGTVKAFVAVLDGAVVGVAGIAFAGLSKARPAPEAFSEMKPVLEPHLKSIVIGRAIMQVRAMIGRTRPPPIAIADKKYPQSEKLLQRLGAVRIGSCEQGEVYQWPN